MMTPQVLNEQARAMPFDQLMHEVAPLISKWSRKHVPGFDQEDVGQELLEVLMLTQRAYNPDKGSFLNLLTRAFSHRIQKLWMKGTRQTLPVIGVVCSVCGAAQSRQHWGIGFRCKDKECGSRKLDVTRGTQRSLDQILDNSMDNSRGGGQSWEPSQEEIGYELVEAADQFHALPASRQQQIIDEVLR